MDCLSPSRVLKVAGKRRISGFWPHALRAQGRRVLVTREPGGTKWAAGIRKLLLDGGDGLSSMAELFLYEADRAQHVHETLMPALQQRNALSFATAIRIRPWLIKAMAGSWI